MPWRKTFFKPQTFCTPDKMYELERHVGPEESGSQHVTILETNFVDINKRQLDPRVCQLQYMIENGITIEPGNTKSMMNLTDVADIEEFNTQYTQEAYKFLQEHKAEIFKQNVEL